MYLRKKISILLVLFFSPLVHSLEKVSKNIENEFILAKQPTIVEYLNSAKNDIAQDFMLATKNSYNLIISPLKWSLPEWSLASAVGISAVIMYNNKYHDRTLFRFERLNVKTGEYDPHPKTFFEKMYLSVSKIPLFYGVSVVGGSYILSTALKQATLQKLSWELLQSMALSGGITLLGSYILAEKRPSDGGEMEYFKTNGHSISGHSAFYASLSGPFNKHFSSIKKTDPFPKVLRKCLFKTVFYGVPALLSYSRLRRKFSNNYLTQRAEPSHFAWNVLLGLALGYTVGEFVAHQSYQESTLEKSKKKSEIN